MKSEIEKSRLLNIWFLGIIIASVWTVIEYFRGVVRPGGFFWYMTFGHFAAIFLGVSIPLIGLKNYKRTSILAVSVFVIGAVALLLTRTRGAWIGFIAGLVLFLIIKQKWLSLASFMVGLALIISIFFVCFPNSGVGKEITSLLRPLDRQTPRAAESNLKRWHMCKASWRMFKKHPFLGIGPYQFRKELPNYLPEQVKAQIFKNSFYDEAHNIYLDCLATMGAIGLLSLLFFLFTVFRLLVLKYKIHKPGFEKNLVLGVLIAFTGFCVAGLFSQSFHDSEILLNLLFLLGLVL
ncbi:MAG: O-antigen ligase family protein [Planctomycetota bacterium]